MLNGFFSNSPCAILLTSAPVFDATIPVTSGDNPNSFCVVAFISFPDVVDLILVFNGFFSVYLFKLFVAVITFLFDVLSSTATVHVRIPAPFLLFLLPFVLSILPIPEIAPPIFSLSLLFRIFLLPPLFALPPGPISIPYFSAILFLASSRMTSPIPETVSIIASPNDIAISPKSQIMLLQSIEPRKSAIACPISFQFTVPRAVVIDFAIPAIDPENDFPISCQPVNPFLPFLPSVLKKLFIESLILVPNWLKSNVLTN